MKGEIYFAQLARGVEYTNCISAEGEDSPQRVAQSAGAVEYTECFSAEG